MAGYSLTLIQICGESSAFLVVSRIKDPGKPTYSVLPIIHTGAFKYYDIKEVGWWGQKSAILDDLQYCKSSKSRVGGPKKVKNMMT